VHVASSNGNGLEKGQEFWACANGHCDFLEYERIVVDLTSDEESDGAESGWSEEDLLELMDGVESALQQQDTQIDESGWSAEALAELDEAVESASV
jgi:hypothetical protein